MPRMDGFQFLNKIRNLPKFSDIPIIVLTTSGSDDIRKKAIDCGANAYLRKPFQADQLKYILDQLNLLN
jgi:CheY-like chemotaxis protein